MRLSFGPRFVTGRARLVPVLVAAAGLSACKEAATVDIRIVDGDRVIHNGDDAPALRFATGAGVAGQLLFERGASVAAPVVVSGDRYDARSVREFALAPVATGDPLVEIIGPGGDLVAGLGRVTVPESAFLGQLVNTGWVAVSDDGSVFFVSALRPEVLRFDSTGDLVWRSIRQPAIETEEPSLEAAGGRLVPRFTELQHAAAIGPDGRLWVLTASSAADSLRLDALTPDGRLAASGRVPLDAEIRVDRRGRVHTSSGGDDKERIADREPFESFDLPSLIGGGRVRLADHAGSIVVVNFWASWCAPCRHEIPELDRLASGYVNGDVIVIGLNEDVDSDAARAFLREIGNPGHAQAEGGGTLRSRYRYVGLPYTVVLDRSGRVAAAFYGFGDSVDPIREVVRSELARSPAAPHPRASDQK